MTVSVGEAGNLSTFWPVTASYRSMLPVASLEFIRLRQFICHGDVQYSSAPNCPRPRWVLGSDHGRTICNFEATFMETTTLMLR